MFIYNETIHLYLDVCVTFSKNNTFLFTCYLITFCLQFLRIVYYYCSKRYAYTAIRFGCSTKQVKLWNVFWTANLTRQKKKIVRWRKDFFEMGNLHDALGTSKLLNEFLLFYRNDRIWQKARCVLYYRLKSNNQSLNWFIGFKLK